MPQISENRAKWRDRKLAMECEAGPEWPRRLLWPRVKKRHGIRVNRFVWEEVTLRLVNRLRGRPRVADPSCLLEETERRAKCAAGGFA